MATKVLNSVQEFYKGKTIFITGGSGFMGKVLIEKLLYSCSDLKEIIILMRAKRGKTAEMRIKEFEGLPLFERIMKEKPEVMKKIHPVWGDICEPEFGLSDEHMGYIIEHTQIVFHLAASLKLEAPLKTNIIMNLTAVKQMCDIAKKMKKLLVMIHSSTAFCIVEHVDIEEKVYDVEENPLDVIKNAENMSEYDLSLVEKKMLGKHLNSYTYTKRLSEVLVCDEYNKYNLPLCIVRPSMVSSTYLEPMTGWVDNLNGGPGVVLAAARGVLRCLLMDVEATKNYIPVDICMNAYIMIGKQLGSMNERTKEVPVYNLNAHKSNVITLGKYFDIADNMRNHIPLSFGLWYPKVTVTNNKYYYYILIFLFQWIPAALIDFLLLIFGQKRFMITVQKKIFTGIDMLKCFLLYNFRFETDNFENLMNMQSEEEKKTFFLDTKQIDTDDYFSKCVVGGRVYLAKDPLTTVPRAKILYRMQYILHLTAHCIFYYWICKRLLTMTGLIDPFMSIVLKIQEFYNVIFS